VILNMYKTVSIKLACWVFLPIAILQIGCFHAVAAEPESVSLSQVVAHAQVRSASAALAKNRFRASYWEYRTQRAAFLPRLTLQGTLPDLSRTISKLTLPDGREAFIPQSVASSGLRLSMAKTVSVTGGEVFIESALDRLDLLNGHSAPSYLSQPISVGFRQPLFAHNPHSWQTQIAPRRYEEARRSYAEELEGIAVAATQTFFDLVAAEDRLTSVRQNCANMDTLLNATRRRRAENRTSEDELLQTELAFLNARLDLQRSELELRARRFAFNAYLGLDGVTEVHPTVTFEMPDVVVDVPRALAQAQALRSDPLAFERRVLEARRSIDEARSGAGRSVSLYASYGLSQSSKDLGGVFRRGQEHQQVAVAIAVPILDWGRGDAGAQLAESNRAVVVRSVEQARAEFEQDVTMKVLQFNVQDERIRIAARADEIARQRFDATKRRYLEGEADATTVNRALEEKDSVREGYIDALRGYWTALYELRRVTLYDFQTNRPIEVHTASQSSP